MQCHEVDYKIIGNDMQIVEIELDPGETVVAEAGAMNYMEDGIAFEARMGDGSAAGEGFILQRLRGDGMAFIHAGGTRKGEGSLLGSLGDLIDGDNR